MCVKCGVPTESSGTARKRAQSRISYVLLGLFLGGFGIHNFVAGYVVRGVCQAVLAVILIASEAPDVTLLIPGLWVLCEVIVVKEDAHGTPFS